MLFEKYKKKIKPGKGLSFVKLDENYIYDPLFKLIDFKIKGLRPIQVGTKKIYVIGLLILISHKE